MLFLYKAINRNGEREEGEIEAFNQDSAIRVLQTRGLAVSSVKEKNENDDILSKIPFFNRVSNKDVVILSRQMSTMFESQVSALKIFKLIGTEAENPALRKHMLEIVNDLQLLFYQRLRRFGASEDWT